MSHVTPLHPPLPQQHDNKLYFGNLPGSSLALTVSNIAREYTGLLLVTVIDMMMANQLEQALKFFSPDLDILSFPDWETLPYDNFSPHQDIVSQRLYALSRLPQLTRGILIVPIGTLSQRLPPRTYIEGSTFIFDRGDKINLDEMRKRLQRSGYRNVSQVMEHGEFAVRGSLLDLFPTGSVLPYRIDLFGDEIDSIRTFDPETQRTIDTVTQIKLLPAREFPITEEAITYFRQKWREQFSGNPASYPIYQDVSQGFYPPGIEYYLPLFFDHTETLLEYFPVKSLVLQIGATHNSAEHFLLEVNERYEQNRYDTTRPILAPEQLYLSVSDLFAKFSTFSQIYLQHEAVTAGAGRYNFSVLAPPSLLIENKAVQPLEKLEDFLAKGSYRVLFCAETQGRREVLIDLLRTISLQPKNFNSWKAFLVSDERFGITVAPLEQGLFLLEPSLVLIAESQLFGAQIMQRRRRKTKTFDGDAIVRNLAELTIGAPVVHIEHGVGRYLGLQILEINGIPAEFLMLEYANEAKLYVPVASLHLISRYSGIDLEHAPLNRLGSADWEKARKKAAEQVHDVAVELLDIYAKRAAHLGHAFAPPDQQYATFAAAFPFEETPDQQQAIADVIADMQSERVMDRLICGDVGFGKTEVAMRAAFIAAQESKQVLILVPTTLLAQQHYQNFKDRFADWPVIIEVVSRFRSKQEQKTVLENLQNGKVDILIGTHRLLQSDVRCKNLGLLIVDEEHRFGVQQKEKLKAMRSQVDVLTLTATPIPRTLNMAMSGLRELSIIATPPARRLSIKTFVRERNSGLIKEAILRELLRGGQVYFLHNDVVSIEKCAQEIEVLVPEARVVIAHGQMPERTLERVMADFYHRRFNILICSTIIETGIDIPTANTIIIDRADKFGLAQLHQLRGRVGRSHHQAYAYLMTPPVKSLTKDAEKRLDAIAALEDLGAGFTLATHDLEIRGAGELLGQEQSGNIQALGFSLYMELLEHSVAALRAGKEPMLDKPLYHGPEIELQIPALIPENYIPDVHTRLIFYKRIANATGQEILQDLQVEMIDRFGLLPETLKNLFQIATLKLKAQKLGIRKIEATTQYGRIEFEEKPNVDPTVIIGLIQKQSQWYKLDGPNRLRFTRQQESKEPIVTQVTMLLECLSGGKRESKPL